MDIFGFSSNTNWCNSWLSTNMIFSILGSAISRRTNRASSIFREPRLGFVVNSARDKTFSRKFAECMFVRAEWFYCQTNLQ